MLDFKKRVLTVISKEKEKSFEESYYGSENTDGVRITPITYDSINSDVIEVLRIWRSENQSGFTKIFNVTHDGTEKWLKDGVLAREDRLLFFIVDKYDEIIGHIGVSSFDFENSTCEIDNVVRGKRSNQHNVMFLASCVLIEWIKSEIDPNEIRLRVLNDNTSALRLYDRLGFKLDSLLGLRRIDSNGCVEWVPDNEEIDRYFVSMIMRCN